PPTLMLERNPLRSYPGRGLKGCFLCPRRESPFLQARLAREPITRNRSPIRVLGLTGRFRQPRPKAWGTGFGWFDPVRVVHGTPRMNGPFRAETVGALVPRPSAWADGNGLLGRRHENQTDPKHPPPNSYHI